MKKAVIPIIILVFSIVLISGCIGNQGGTSIAENDGIIANFVAEPPVVDEGDIVSFMLDVQNQGAVEATDISVELSNIASWRDPSTGNELVDDTFNRVAVKPLIPSLDPPEQRSGSPGELEILMWNLRTPELVPTGLINLDVKANILYDYKTTGNILMSVIGKEYEYVEYTAKGKQVDSPIVFNTYAPVKLYLDDTFANYHKSFDEDGEEEQDFTIIFKLANVGSGYPLTAQDEYGAFTGTIRASGPVYFRDCLGIEPESGDQEIEITDEDADLVRLRAYNGEVRIPCSLYVDRDGFGTLPEERVSFQFDLDYTYYVEAMDTVSIYTK